MTTDQRTEAWVRGYAELGWHVLPLPPNRKASPPEGTTGAGGRDLSPGEVLAGLDEGGNLGLRMPDGVVGLDVDSYDGKVGAETLYALEVLHGRLPDTPRLTSREDDASGIRFFRVPAGTELGTVGRDVDTIRRSWRYAVAAPSVHPSGRPYRWLDADGRPCRPPAVADLPELPVAWLAAFPYEPEGPDRTGTGLSGRDAARYAKEWWRALPPGLAECAPVQDAREKAVLAATRRGPTGTGRNDLVAPVLVLASAAEAGCGGVREAIEEAGRRYCLLPDGEDHSYVFWHLLGTTLDRLGSFDPWECQHLTPEERDELPAVALGLAAASEAAGSEPADPGRLGYVDFGDEGFWDPEPPRWFIPGMLIEGEVCTIYSAGGQGKSLLAQDVALGLAARGTVFGEPVGLADVLYLDRENSARGLSKRLRAMGHRGPLPRLHYSLLGQWPPLDTRAGGDALLSEVRRTGARLVVLDTMSKMVDGEENANDTWNGLHSHSMVALKQAGVTVIQLDHTGKDQDKGQRGGSSKQNNADVIWKLSHAAGFVTLRNEKDREGEYEKTVLLERSESPVLAHLPTEAGGAAVAAAVREDAAVEGLVAAMDELDLPASTGRARASAALRDGGVRFRTDQLAEALRRRKETA